MSKRINLGAGQKPKKGYTNIDILPLVDIDVIADFRDLEYSDLDKVRAFHILEHFSREEGIALLKQRYSWLKVGGELALETPDFEMICKNFDRDKYWMSIHTFGSQENEHSFHKDGWYEEKFRQVLPQIGFEVEDVRKNTTRKILPNIQIVAFKNA